MRGSGAFVGVCRLIAQMFSTENEGRMRKFKLFFAIVRATNSLIATKKMIVKLSNQVEFYFLSVVVSVILPHNLWLVIINALWVALFVVTSHERFLLGHFVIQPFNMLLALPAAHKLFFSFFFSCVMPWNIMWGIFQTASRFSHLGSALKTFTSIFFCLPFSLMFCSSFKIAMCLISLGVREEERWWCAESDFNYNEFRFGFFFVVFFSKRSMCNLIDDFSSLWILIWCDISKKGRHIDSFEPSTSPKCSIINFNGPDIMVNISLK